MLKYFPLKKSNVTLNNSNTDFLLSYKETTEIPVEPHPGSFGYDEKIIFTKALTSMPKKVMM